MGRIPEEIAISWKSVVGRLAVGRSTGQLRTTNDYIPGNFIPAILRAKLGLPICLNIFFICAYCRSRLLTACTLVPEPRAMRVRRLPWMA